MAIFGRVWGGLVRFGSKMAPRALTMSDADFEAERQTVFDNAKRVSDFVGMIARLAFIQFVFLYFLREAPKAEGVWSWAMGLFCVSSLGLSIYLARAIMRIVFLWEIRDARKTDIAWAKGLFLGFAILTTAAIYFALMHLVYEIASTNALIAAT